MPKAASFSPLQLFSPIQLIFCLVLFFLPWVEVQCVPPPDVTKNAPKEKIEAIKKETGIDPTKPLALASQSGFQIATGDGSVSSDFKNLIGQKAKAAGGGGRGGESEVALDPFAKGPDQKKDGEAAPLLFLFPVVLLAGIVLGFIPWPGIARKLIVLGCCLGALGIVGLQAAIGFPVETELKKRTEQMKQFGDIGDGGGMRGAPPGAGAGNNKAEAKEPDNPFRISWKIPLYLTFLLLLGSAGTAFLGASGAKKRKRPVYDFDDDEDDDYEDERPRKKRRAVVEELPDEDRPRKKPAFEVVPDDEIDERPRKKGKPTARNSSDYEEDPPKKKPKRRDDDEDEDDRPRKKKRRDDD